jgi:hypothetical protein
MMAINVLVMPVPEKKKEMGADLFVAQEHKLPVPIISCMAELQMQDFRPASVIEVPCDNS